MLIPVFAPEARPLKTYTPAAISYHIRQENNPYQPHLPRVIARNFENPLDSTVHLISHLRHRAVGWDGHNAPAPDPQAIGNARRWIEQAFGEVADKAVPWREPYVSSDESGNVTFEWWHANHKLTVYVMPEVVEYVQVWGTDIISQMDDGELTRPGQWRALWSWLHTP